MRVLVICLLTLLTGCGNVFYSVEERGSQKPDQGLFELAMKAVDNQGTQEARTLLETMVCTYPDSEYVGRATMMLDGIWSAEGGVGPRPELTGGEGVTFFPPLEETPAQPEPKVSGTKSLQKY